MEMTLDYALKSADQIVGCLRLYCHRIEVAGSVRRKKPADIKDIEIVLIPKTSLAGALATMINTQWGRPSIGVWPAKYTKIRSACSIDIFTVTPETWGLLFFIRTGPAEFSHKALTRWKQLTGGHSEGGRLTNPDGTRIATPEEKDVFAALQWDFIPPEKRL
jgi:DNA polymerase/3'-5' exonuclease PolX